MIFLSAQPDESYFLWQLEIQLTNFRKFGVKREDIHVLLGYSKTVGLNYLYSDFIERYNSFATFFCYQDNRKNKKYQPSIRPHIIKQHFKKYKALEKAIVFYHDCDITFTTKLPDFQRMSVGDTWYFSDTRSYLDSKFILSHGDNVFKEMCKIVGVSEKEVKVNDDNAGGAQTIIKNVNYKFWDKLEKDCAKIYAHLIENESRYANDFSSKTNLSPSEYKPIPAWCADMWALLWGGIKKGVEIKIDKELDFCWPHHDVIQWRKSKIFHNAGVDQTTMTRYFYKARFLTTDPYYFDFNHVSKKCCSSKYLSQLAEVESFRKYRLLDTTFYLVVSPQSQSEIEKILLFVEYILQYFETNILIVDCGLFPNNYISNKYQNITYIPHPFSVEDNFTLERIAIENCLTNIVLRCDIDLVVPPPQINKAVLSVRYNKCDFSYTHQGHAIIVKRNAMQNFLVNKDIKRLMRLLNKRENDFVKIKSLRSIAMKKDAFMAVGLGNKSIKSQKYKDKELYFLYKVSKYKVYRQEGFAFITESLVANRDPQNVALDISEYLKTVNNY